VLTDHVGDPEPGLHFNELDPPKLERDLLRLPVPSSVLGFRETPPLGDRDDKPAAPTAGIVADMDDDLCAIALRECRVSDDELDRHAIP
jgi:hypothetical protein